MIIKFQPVPAPWYPEARLQQGLNTLLEDFFNEDGACDCGMVPRMDVSESAGEYTVVAEIPGMKREEIKIVVQENALTISGERKEAGVEGSRWVRNEIPAGKFERSIELSVPVEAGKVSATLSNGILRVVLPKSDAARPKEITIQ